MEILATKEKAKEAITKAVYEGRLNNEDLVEIINHCGVYLNIESPPAHAKRVGISPQAAHKKSIRIFGKPFVTDNA